MSVLDEPLLVKKVRYGYVFCVDEVLDYLGNPTKNINGLVELGQVQYESMGMKNLRWSTAHFQVYPDEGCTGLAANAIYSISRSDTTRTEVGFDVIGLPYDDLCLSF